MATTKDHCIDVPGGKLFAREWSPATAADGPPLVLLHDSLGSVELWRDFPSQLAEATARRVIAYDRLGFGKSDARSDRLSERFVREEAEIYLRRLLRQLHIGRFVAFGHSVGGGMAVYCGTTLADSCTALILESAQMFAEDLTLRGVAAARIEFQDPANLARLARYHGEKAQWVLEAWTETWLSPAFASFDLEAELAKIRCPVLAIHGDGDEYGSVQHPERIRKRAGGPVTIRVMAGVGHVPHREQPGRVLYEVVDFLEGIDRS